MVGFEHPFEFRLRIHWETVPIVKFEHVLVEFRLVPVLPGNEPPQVRKMQVEPLLPDGTINHEEPPPVLLFIWRHSVLKFSDSASTNGKSQVVPKQKITVLG